MHAPSIAALGTGSLRDHRGNWRAAEAGPSQLGGDAGLDAILSKVLKETIGEVFWGILVVDARIRN